ncbi:MAG TPA: AraC family transcriptional regulator [Granulicella sp.]|nr:AraC family transcriptional regulator [Granulicella sp.]
MLAVSIEMDSLSPFFEHFTLSARVFYSGRLCGVSGDHATETAGHLHLLRRGTLHVERPQLPPITIAEPSVLFYPRPCRHRFRADPAAGAELVCARIEFGAGMQNPLVQTLPELLIVPLASVHELAPTANLLFTEAFAEHPGRQAAIDHLTEYALVLLLRAAMNRRLIAGGVLLGLADPRLALAIAAMHQQPAHPWSLETLAQTAGMSRARFAVHFRQIVGVTPFDYLADWRIGIAQTLLRKGMPLKIVAPAVGYASSTALTRVFSQRLGLSPTVWIAHDRRTQQIQPPSPAK